MIATFFDVSKFFLIPLLISPNIGRDDYKCWEICWDINRQTTKVKKTPELQNGMIEHGIFYTQTELIRQARGGSSARTGYATMCE